MACLFGRFRFVSSLLIFFFFSSPSSEEKRREERGGGKLEMEENGFFCEKG